MSVEVGLGARVPPAHLGVQESSGEPSVDGPEQAVAGRPPHHTDVEPRRVRAHLHHRAPQRLQRERERERERRGGVDNGDGDDIEEDEEEEEEEEGED